MPTYFDENTQTSFSSFEEYKQLTTQRYTDLKSALLFLKKYALKHTKNDFKLALESLKTNLDSLNLEEKKFVTMLLHSADKVDLNQLYNSFQFLLKFSRLYTKGDLFLAMQSLQFNQECLTRPEKKLLSRLLLIK